jgi:hypothetical protein
VYGVLNEQGIPGFLQKGLDMSINGAISYSGISDPDIEISHGLLNHLNSGYQGKFAFLNILLQLEHPFENTALVDETRGTLGTVNGWLKDLWQGGAIINHLWQEPRTFTARQAMQLVGQLREDVIGIGNDVLRCLAEQSFRDSRLETIMLVAAYGWNAYARDNFIRCFYDYGKKFEDQTILENFEQLLAEAEEKVRFTHDLMKQLRSSETLTDEFCESLYIATGALPGTFYALAHDLNQLHNRFEREFTFEMAEISEEEAALWQQLHITPVDAGYWRSHGMLPEEAYYWKTYGIHDFAAAASWKLWGVTPEEASEWTVFGFTPASSLIWSQNGFPPEKARHFVDKGMLDPNDIPEYLLY